MSSGSLKVLISPPPFAATRAGIIRHGNLDPNSLGFIARKPKSIHKSLKCIHNSDSGLGFKSKSSMLNQGFAVSFSTAAVDAPIESAVAVAGKLRLLASEFKSLSEPIDRVKRLLLYASALPSFGESVRVPENRVPGCATQVWLDVKIDELGRMRFRADSDSEIAKGFCACLIWMLDGAEPEEVIAVRSEELIEMNVGFHGKAESRVNTWQNVLIGMQKRTKALLAEERPLPRAFPPLLVAADSLGVNGSYFEAQVTDYSIPVVTLHPPIYDYII